MPDEPSTPPPPESAEWLKYCGPNWYGEQDENGVDLSQIRENLKLSPIERIRRAEQYADEARMLQAHGRRHREKSLRKDCPGSTIDER